MSYIAARIAKYYSEENPIHCVVCEKDNLVGVSVTFDSGFMSDVDMCMDCLKEVLAFKDRVTDPAVKAATLSETPSSAPAVEETPEDEPAPEVAETESVEQSGESESSADVPYAESENTGNEFWTG